jgi:hypothetical protein
MALGRRPQAGDETRGLAYKGCCVRGFGDGMSVVMGTGEAHLCILLLVFLVALVFLLLFLLLLLLVLARLVLFGLEAGVWWRWSCGGFG